MSLIEFQDYPSTETPLNAENLNHNFEVLYGKTLYENSSGSNGTITLNDNIDNYSKFELYSLYGKIHTIKNQSVVSLDEMIYDNASVTSINATTKYSLNGNTFTPTFNVSFKRSYSSGTISGDVSTNYIYITKVVGYK